MTDADLITQALAAFNEQRWDVFMTAYATEAAIEYPQSGERIAGAPNIRRLVESFPSAPRFHPTRVHRAGETVIVEVEADYGDGVPWSGVFVYEIGDGLITHERAYFAAPFEPADWRAPFRDRSA